MNEENEYREVPTREEFEGLQTDIVMLSASINNLAYVAGVLNDENARIKKVLADYAVRANANGLIQESIAELLGQHLNMTETVIARKLTDRAIKRAEAIAGVLKESECPKEHLAIVEDACALLKQKEDNIDEDGIELVRRRLEDSQRSRERNEAHDGTDEGGERNDDEEESKAEGLER